MDLRLARGVEQFNAGSFFEAHETWEELWNDTVGPEKSLIQGLVQIAAGYAKVESGVRAGALKLLASGLGLVRPFPAAAFGLSLEPFTAGVAADIARLRAATEVTIDEVRPPSLGCVEDSPLG
jgi:predicted metal-dependent hydrolase